MNLRKKIRTLADEKPILPNPETQKFLRKMTNWQNSQWLRDGAKPARAQRFSQRARP